LEEDRCGILEAGFEMDSVTAIYGMERLGSQKPDDFSLLATHSFRMVGKQDQGGTIEGLRAALQLDPANARVTAHLGRRLPDHALEQGSDPDEARGARRDADFLTSRALKLVPDNDEVKRLRDEVVKLLELKTD
jgi:hypothetical protein